MRSLYISLAVLVLGSVAAIRAAEPVEIVIDHYAFAPEEISVRKGETVRWINRDSVPHVVAVGEVSSPVLAPGESFEWTFARAGSVTYGCPLHPRMVARFTVEEN